jgi:methionyl-tRNA formyltransferase
MKFVFFGTDEFAVTVLESLREHELVPSHIVTAIDKPKGRKLVLTPPPVKVWADANNIHTLQPKTLKDDSVVADLQKIEADLYIVASYGKIIPEAIFNLPKYKTLNIHPSLLSKLRGPSPVATAILDDIKDTGVSIMQIDAQMDHGPILAQEHYVVAEWPPRPELEKELAKLGADMLAKVIPQWIGGTLTGTAQRDEDATYTKMIMKADALININDDPYLNFRKIQAYKDSPGAFMVVRHNNKDTRVIINDAVYADGKLNITSVTPEGKRTMSYADFMRGFTPQY